VRIHELANNAFPRAKGALGAEAFASVVDGYLEASGPRTRYFWRVPLELADRLACSEVPPHVADLARFESARWRLRHEAFPTPPAAAPLEFERPPLLNPARELLKLSHRADVRGEEHVHEERLLCLHRGADHRVSVLVLNPLSHALLEDFAAGDASLAGSVKRVTERRGVAITERFLEGLSEMLERFLREGLVLGSAPR